jgi:hypothetical protein
LSLYETALQLQHERKEIKKEIKRKVFVQMGTIAHSYSIMDVSSRLLGDVLRDNFPDVHIHNVISGVGEPVPVPARTKWQNTPIVLIIQT